MVPRHQPLLLARAAAAATPISPMATATAKCPLRASAKAADLSKKGYDLNVAGDSHAALACHRRAVDLDPRNIFAHWHKAQAENKLGLYSLARESLEKALGKTQGQTLPDEIATEAHFQLGKIYKDTNELRLAVVHYKKAIEVYQEALEFRWRG